MKRLTALGAVFAIFLVGLAGGVAGAHLFYEQKVEARSERVPFLSPHYMGRLDRRLDLTPEQKREIDGILHQAHQEADSLRREVRPRIHRLMERAHRQIKDILTPEQRQRFEKFSAHGREWHGPRLEGRHERHHKRRYEGLSEGGKHPRPLDVYPDEPPHEGPPETPPETP